MNYYLQHFLESSTIHGLVYISTERKLLRFLWLLIVITGFSIATYLINDAFDNWSESPIKTTIEKRSISEITFPKVTVCPPKNSFTDLNYDLMMLENMTLTNDARQELLKIAVDNLLTQDDRDWLSIFSALEEENRWYNWYHGYSKIETPYRYGGSLTYNILTSATTGSIKTQYFGDKYDPDKIERILYYRIEIHPPGHVVKREDYTLSLGKGENN